MKSIELFFLLLAVTCLVFLGVGLYRPWVMLWWEDIQNRRKVVKLYGLLGLVFLTVYLIVRLGIHPSY